MTTTGAGHLRLLTPRARAAGGVAGGAAGLTAGRARAEPPPRPRRAGRHAGRELLAGDIQGTDDTDDAIAARHSSQRRVRLVANAQAFARLDEVIRLVASAYHLHINWLCDGNANESIVRPEAVEARIIASQLAPARQIALVIGDPERQILWMSQRPFVQARERIHTAPVPLERVRCLADVADDVCLVAEDMSSMTSPVSSPAERLMRQCGPVGRALVAQSNALLALAPQVADCPARLRHYRYVLAAPVGFARLRDSAVLTSWAERLLCISLHPVSAVDTLAAGLAALAAISDRVRVEWSDQRDWMQERVPGLPRIR